MERLLTLYSEVQSTDVRWLWYPFIAIGKITLLQGDPGDGKSTMMMNLIAELSTGGKTPDGCKIGAPQKVIYQCSEDGVSDTIKPRLERCGADCRKIAFINEEVYNGLTLDDERMRLLREECRLEFWASYEPASDNSGGKPENECWERCYPYSWKSGLYLRFAEERSEVYCNHAVCCGASHVL